jgi:hypothetical protein
LSTCDGVARQVEMEMIKNRVNRFKI